MKINQQVIVKRWKPIFETMCNQLGIKQSILGLTGLKPMASSRPSGSLLEDY